MILFPDTSAKGKAFEKWMHIAKEAQGAGIKVTVSRLLEDECTTQRKQEGYDIGDFLIESSKDTKRKIESKPTIINQMFDRVPIFDLLISTFDLQVIDMSSI